MPEVSKSQRGNVAAVYILPALLINVGNAAAYLFQLVLGRSMSAADFGTFNAIFALVLIATAPTNVLHLIVAHLAIGQRAQGGDHDGALLRVCLAASAVAAAVVVLAGLPLIGIGARRFASDGWTIFAAVLTVALSFIWPGPAGLLQARGGHLGFGVILCAMTVSRFAGGLLFVALLGYGVGGAMWACALSLFIALGIGLWLERGLLGTPADPPPLKTLGREAFRYGWPQLATALLVAALTNLDVTLVRLFDQPDMAGLYAGASVVSRIGLLLPSALTSIIFVESARNRTGLRQFLAALGITAGLAACVLLPVLIAPDLVLRLLLGTRYVDAATLLRVTMMAMCCMAVAQAAMMYLLGRRQYAFMGVVAVVVAIFLVAVQVLKPGAAGMAQLLLIGNATVMLGCTTLAVMSARREF